VSELSYRYEKTLENETFDGACHRGPAPFTG
jgi:hypothetical protein